MADASQPFARGQAQPFQTGPFLGGYVVVLVVAISAGGVIVVQHALRVPPRHVEVLSAGIGTYPSRAAFSAVSATRASVMLESAQPAGTVLWLW